MDPKGMLQIAPGIGDLLSSLLRDAIHDIISYTVCTMLHESEYIYISL